MLFKKTRNLVIADTNNITGLHTTRKPRITPQRMGQAQATPVPNYYLSLTTSMLFFSIMPAYKPKTAFGLYQNRNPLTKKDTSQRREEGL